jgi:general secretion pathway protein A
MYTRFYGLQQNPFEIAPDPRFLYMSEGHQEALARLIYGVKSCKGFLLLTGEVGTGKTTLVNALMEKLNSSTMTISISNPRLSVADFYRSIYLGLEFRNSYKSKVRSLSDLHTYLKDAAGNGKTVLLIVDEAQALSQGVLEEIRLLSNLEIPERKLLNVFLLGQPELRETLSHPTLRALYQRIGIQYHIRPLDRKNTRNYIIQRLQIAGAYDPNLFTPRAMKYIYKYTRGYPRLINILCDNALISGFARGEGVINRGIIRECVRDIGLGGRGMYPEDCWSPVNARRSHIGRFLNWFGKKNAH